MHFCGSWPMIRCFRHMPGPLSKTQQATVNLGYVINVIENPAERSVLFRRLRQARFRLV